jgi:hypothetical protein
MPGVQGLSKLSLTALIVQVRLGDWQLTGDHYAFQPQRYPSLFDHYFQCAEEIRQERAMPGQHMVR